MGKMGERERVGDGEREEEEEEEGEEERQRREGGEEGRRGKNKEGKRRRGLSRKGRSWPSPNKHDQSVCSFALYNTRQTGRHSGTVFLYAEGSSVPL